MNHYNKNLFLVISSSVSFIIAILEVLQAVLFFNLVYSIFNSDNKHISFLPSFILEYPLLFLTLFLLLYFIFIYFHGFIVQKYSLGLYKNLTYNTITMKTYRELPMVIKNYYNKLPFEVLVRLGYGYYGSLSFIIARSLITIFMVVYLAFEYTEIFLISAYIAIPAVLATVCIIYFQKRLGKVVSDWNNSLGKYISETVANLTISNYIISDTLSKNEKKLLVSNALSQSLSNFNKPMIEFIIAVVLFLYFSKDSNNFVIDSVGMALLYRIYGNLTTIVSLSNQYSSSSSAKASVESAKDEEINTYKNALNDSYVSLIDKSINIDFLKNGGVEIRGASGKGKTLTIEYLVNIYRNKSIKVFLWMNSLEFSDISVKYYIEDVLVLNTKELDGEFIDFLKTLSENSMMSSLSLGQKSRLGIYLSKIVESDIVVLDEPFANLDATNTIYFQKMIRDLSLIKKVVVTNHDYKIDGFVQVELK